MAMPAFDTLKAAKALKEAGFEETQAEAVVASVGGAMSENVAAKTDLADLEARLYQHLWIMAAGIVGVTVTLVKLIRNPEIFACVSGFRASKKPVIAVARRRPKSATTTPARRQAAPP